MASFTVGLVGAGYVSAHHIRALHALGNAQIVGIADLNVELARSVAARFGIPRAFATTDELLALRPAAIHVLTPPAAHAAVTIQALHAGAHVLVEKPMAETIADCDRMMAAAAAAGRVLGVNHSGRMDPAIVRAVDMTRSGAIGEVVDVHVLRASDYAPPEGGYTLPPPFRTGSYPLQDLGAHAITIIEAFLGPARSAEIQPRSTRRDVNLLFDEWNGTVECERGAGHFAISWNAKPVSNEVVVRGTRGSIRIDCFLQTVNVTKVLPGPKFASGVVGAMRSSAVNLVTVPLNVMRFVTGRMPGAPGIHRSVRDFYAAIEAGGSAPATSEEGRRVISLMQGATEAADRQYRWLREEQLRTRRPARVLVTGAGGFLGRALVARLVERGDSVRVAVRRPTNFPANVDVTCGDLGDPQFVDAIVAGVDAIFHVGAAMKGSAADFRRGTVWGTRNVLSAAAKHGVKRLVYVSSMSVLDHASASKAAVTESWPYEPHPERRGLYTQTKLEAEKLVLEAAANGLSTVILRPGVIFGPGAEHVSPAGSFAMAGRWVVVGNGKKTLPLVYVDDMVDALLKAEDPSAGTGEIYHVVDPAPVTQKAYVTAARRRIATPVVYVPRWCMLAAGAGFNILGRVLKRDLPLSTYRVRSIAPLGGFDVTKSVRQLGWQPRVGSHEGLNRTFGATQNAGAQRAAAAAGQE